MLKQNEIVKFFEMKMLRNTSRRFSALAWPVHSRLVVGLGITRRYKGYLKGRNSAIIIKKPQKAHLIVHKTPQVSARQWGWRET